MLHLSIERLAALADEQPTAEEHAHLAQCADCARELDAHRSLLAMAGTQRDAMGLPLTRWDSLSDRLRREGLITRRTPIARTSHWGLQAAAALLLVAGGVALGRATTSESVLPGVTSASSTQGASANNASNPVPSFASVEDAVRWKDFYSNGYQRALAYLAQSDSGSRPAETPAVMKARLAALNSVAQTMQEALSDAPYDPIINDFYLNSFGQREATLRQLNTVLPQNVRLNSF
jgi:hypothetical protein